MRFLVQPSLNLMTVDNLGLIIDLSAVDPGIYRVLWDDTLGRLYQTGQPEVGIDFQDPTPYQPLINEWLGAAPPGFTVPQAQGIKAALVTPLGALKLATATVSSISAALSTAATSTAPGNFQMQLDASQLIAAAAALSTGEVTGAVAPPSKAYWEVTVGGKVGQSDYLGVIAAGDSITVVLGHSANGYAFESQGQKYHANVRANYGSRWVINDVIGCAFGGSNLWFARNGVWQGGATVAEIVAGNSAHAAYSGITGTYYPALYSQSGVVYTFNFGASPFRYAPPSGFTGWPGATWDASPNGLLQLLTANANYVASGTVPSMTPLLGAATVLDPATLLNLINGAASKQAAITAAQNSIIANLAATPDIPSVIAFDVTQGWP